MLALIGWICSYLLPPLSIFLIILILLQRGKGGGLVGAFGGMGGQSAFGAKAGDVFTRITIVTVSIWIFCCIFVLLGMKNPPDASHGLDLGKAPAEITAPVA